MEPYVIALPIQVCTSNGPPPLQVDAVFSVVGLDANGVGIALGLTYCYDNSNPVASNIANIKALIVKQVESTFNITLLTNNVNLVMTVN